MTGVSERLLLGWLPEQCVLGRDLVLPCWCWWTRTGPTEGSRAGTW